MARAMKGLLIRIRPSFSSLLIIMTVMARMHES